MDSYLEKYLEMENESIVQLWNKIIDVQRDFSNETLDLNIQNNIESYESLIEEKKGVITESTQSITIFSNSIEEFGVTKPLKSSIDRQNDVLDKFKEEIKNLNKLHDALMDNSIENLPKRVFKNLENI